MTSTRPTAFTLIELLVVITIVVVLMGLLFPAFRGVQDQAKSTQAKNDLVQIVTAVNAFYTEYGKYPLATSGPPDITFGGGSGGSSSKRLFDALRGIEPKSPTMLNPRQIAFISPPDAKDQARPHNGMKISDGQFYDPWGTTYAIAIDADYSNDIPNPYTTGAGSNPLRSGVLAWSFGKDTRSATVPGPADDKKIGPNNDDLISWQ